MKKKQIIGIMAAVSLVGWSTAFAEPTDATSATTPAGTPRGLEQRGIDATATQDRSAAGTISRETAGAEAKSFNKEAFLKEVGQNGIAEVNMAQVGATKAQDPGLKEVSQRLVTDHSKLNEQVKELAQKEGVTLSTEVDAKHQKMIDHLSGLSGAEFDKAYAMHMEQGHKKSIAKFKQASTCDDAEVSQFAKSTLPTLQEHLALIQKHTTQSNAGAAVNEPAGAQPDQTPAENYKKPANAEDPTLNETAKPATP